MVESRKDLATRCGCSQGRPGPGWIAMLVLVLLGQPGLVVSQTPQEIERVFWESVACEKEGQVRAYLKTYPEGTYVAEAWACLEEGLGLDSAKRMLIQQGLMALGKAVGAADGLFGPATREAIRGWQAGKGFAGTGYLTEEQANTLIAQGQAAAAEQRQAQAEAERQRQEAAARADDAAYAAAEAQDSVEGYGEYLRAYPAGRHASAARARKAAVRDEEVRRRQQAEAEARAAEERNRQAEARGDIIDSCEWTAMTSSELYPDYEIRRPRWDTDGYSVEEYRASHGGIINRIGGCWASCYRNHTQLLSSCNPRIIHPTTMQLSEICRLETVNSYNRCLEQCCA